MLTLVCVRESWVMSCFRANASEWLARLDLALAGVSEALAVIANEYPEYYFWKHFAILFNFVSIFCFWANLYV